MASNKQIKERIRSATVIANRAVTFPEMSKATGVPEVSLRGFVSTGSLGKSRLASLEEWLEKKGYMSAVDIEPTGPRPTLLSGLAQELHGLATILEANGLDDATKLSTFRDRILGYAKTFDKYGIGSK